MGQGLFVFEHDANLCAIEHPRKAMKTRQLHLAMTSEIARRVLAAVNAALTRERSTKIVLRCQNTVPENSGIQGLEAFPEVIFSVAERGCEGTTAVAIENGVLGVNVPRSCISDLIEIISAIERGENDISLPLNEDTTVWGWSTWRP